MRLVLSQGQKIKITRIICSNLRFYSDEMVRVCRLFMQLGTKYHIHKATTYIGFKPTNKKTKRNEILATKEN